MVAMTSFHATKCCHLLSEHKVYAGAYAAASISYWPIVHPYLLILCSIFWIHYGLDQSVTAGLLKQS